MKKRNSKLIHLLKGIVIIFLISLFAEIFVFNLKSFVSDNEVIEYSQYQNIECDDLDSVWISDDSITIYNDTSIYIDINKEDINALQIEYEVDKDDDRVFTCCLSIKDGNFSRQFIKVGEKKFSQSYGSCVFSFISYEELQAIELDFMNVGNGITINKICYSKALPFSFSLVRFLGMLICFSVLWTIWTFKLYKVEYDRKNKKHFAVLVVLTIVSALSMLVFLNPKAEDIEYSRDLDFMYHDPFVQMFDAVHNNRLNIDIEPSEELLNMDNPYDFSVREEDNVFVAWDRAFYNGKYYSYFGIAPVLTFYYPYYFITSKLPSVNKACVFFGMLSIIFLYGMVLAFVKKFIKKPNFLLLITGLVAVTFASGISFMVNFSDMYALPGVAGSCYMLLCLWCGFEAYGRNGGKGQKILFALCGIAFCLCLASKPTRALSCLVLAPAFIEILISKSRTVKEKILSAGSFLLPVAIGVGLIMVYNSARFSSPFDFGATYQLTVSNVNANKLRINLIPDALINYFLRPVQMKGIFPFVEIGFLFYGNSQSYIYNAFAIGAFAMPMILIASLGMPYIIYTQRKSKDNRALINVKNATYIMMFAMAVIIAWFNYCIAGIIFSYVCDILPILAIMSVFVILEIAEYFKKNNSYDGKVISVIFAVLVFNIILVILEILSFDNLAWNYRMPNLYNILQDAICFWI